MLSIKGHFDGRSVVLDEPATLAVGQVVQVVVDQGAADVRGPRKPRFGFGKDVFKFIMRDDFNDPLDEFAEYR